MANSARLGLPFLSTSQSQKEVTHNEALRILDVLVNCCLVSRSISTPPGSPTDGQAWLVAASPTGAWAGQSGKIAIWYGGWTFTTVTEGFTALVDDEDISIIYADGTYSTFGGGGGGGGSALVVPTAASSAAMTQLTSTAVGKLSTVSYDSANSIVYLPDVASRTPGETIRVKRTGIGDNFVRVNGAVQNELLWSEDQSQTSKWDLANCTISTNVGQDPDGNFTLDKIQETTSNTSKELDQDFIKPAGVTRIYAVCVLQAAERSFATVSIDQGSATNRGEYRVNLSTGAITNSASAGTATYVSGDSSVTALAHGNYLVKIAIDVSTTTAEETWQFRVRLYNAATVYTGTTGSGIYCGRFQVYFESVSPAYVATTTARAFDKIDGVEFKLLRSKDSSITLVASGDPDWRQLRSEESVDEGTFTPTIKGSTTAGTMTYGTRIGRYIRKGRILEFWIVVEATTVAGSPAGDLQVGGLPFAAMLLSGMNWPVSVEALAGLTITAGKTMVNGFVASNATSITLRESGSAVAAANIAATAAASGIKLVLHGSIEIN